MRRHLELGLEAEGVESFRGLVQGCDRLSEREGGDALGWAPHFSEEVSRWGGLTPCLPLVGE